MASDELKAVLQTVIDDFRGWPLAPIMHNPSEAGLYYEDIYFPSDDGVPLEGWFIPCENSNKIRIANDPHWFTLTVMLNWKEVVTLMTLGSRPEALVLGYLKNQSSWMGVGTGSRTVASL